MFSLLINKEIMYKIQEEGTNGWADVCEPRIKEECIKYYEALIAEGSNPERIKIVRVK